LDTFASEEVKEEVREYKLAQGAEVAVHYRTNYTTLSEAMLVSPSGKDELTRLRI